MKFGLFYEISVPRPWGPETEKTVYDRCLEQVKLADELGFDHVWAVEHHFLEEYSHCPAPELFLTACATKTKHIRVGHGIVVCVPEINHPISIAERTAVLDILSGGRLDVGTGRSATWTELGGFRANPDLTKETWDEFVRCLPKMWTQERYAYDGVSWSMPRADGHAQALPEAAPADVGGGDQPRHRDRCRRARHGQPWPHLRRLRRAGRRRSSAIARSSRTATPVGAFVNEQVATVNFLYCHEDDAEGVKIGQADDGMFNYLAAQLLAAREVYPTSPILRSGCCPRCGATCRGPATNPARQKESRSATPRESRASSRSGKRAASTG